MSEFYVKLFVLSIICYFIILNLSLIFIIEPKFIAKHISHFEWYKKFQPSLSILFLITLFIASFFLGMSAFLMKIFNTMVIL